MQSTSRASVAVASVVSADSLKSKYTGSSRHSVGGGAGARSFVPKPFMQAPSCAQSSSVLQGFFALQAPLTQWPPAQSLSLLQAWHLLAMHAWFAGQSELLLQ